MLNAEVKFQTQFLKTQFKFSLQHSELVSVPQVCHLFRPRHSLYWETMTVEATSTVELDGAERRDEDVIEQVLGGNTAMFELLMRRYNERVYRAARAIVRDDQEAEDVMQQAYVNAFAHLRQFNGSARFSTWLTRIAINEALARVRRRGTYESYDDERPEIEPFKPREAAENPERQAFTMELRGLLEWAIDTLPDGMREVFVLREVEGLSTSEVADALDVSEDVVKTRLSRGRAALRRVLISARARPPRRRSVSIVRAATGSSNTCCGRSPPAEPVTFPRRATLSCETHNPGVAS